MEDHNTTRPCPLCNERLPIPEKVTENEQPFQCDFCGKQIRWQWEWQRDYDVDANFDDLVIWLETVN